MPPRLAPKPAEEPKTERQLSRAEELGQTLESKCPNVTLRESEMPHFRKDRMPTYIFILIFASYWWLKSDQRLPVREEVESIVYMLYDTEPLVGESQIALFRILENSNRRTTKVLEGLKDQEKEVIKSLVTPIYEGLLKEDPRARNIDRNLRGFQGKLTNLPFKSQFRPSLEGCELRDDQIYLGYGLNQWCKDSVGNSICTGDHVTMVFGYCGITLPPKNKTPFFKNIADPDHWLFQMVTVSIMEPRHRTHFERKAHEVHTDYSTKGKLKFPAQDYRPVIDTVSESDLAATTVNFAAMTVTASSSGSRQPTAPAPGHVASPTDWNDFDDWPGSEPQGASPAPSETTFEEFIDWSGRGGSEPTEAPPPPSGISGNDPTGKNKGKGRERASLSSSPGTAKRQRTERDDDEEEEDEEDDDE